MTKNLFIVLIMNTFLSIAQADIEPHLPGIAYPPHQIKHQPQRLLSAPSGLTPTQVSTAYGFNVIPYQGEGQTIGIVDAYDNPTAETDFATFNTAFGLPDCTTANGCFTKVYATGSQPAQNTNWGLEIALDIQWAHAIAPKAKILLVEAADASYAALFSAINVAVTQGAKTISLSWGGNEFSGQTSYDMVLRNHIVNSGVTFFVASGDNGHGVSYPSTSTYVIAVGGTSLSLNGSNYRTETAWSGSGGGLSVYEPETGPQIASSIPNNFHRKRSVPDVSYHANPSLGYSVYDTASGGWMVVGGTSAGSPQWAALLAIAKSGTHKNLTSVYAALYALSRANYKYYFNDIASGTNGSCGYYCAARASYDYVTGVGSPQAVYVVNGLLYNALH